MSVALAPQIRKPFCSGPPHPKRPTRRVERPGAPSHSSSSGGLLKVPGGGAHQDGARIPALILKPLRAELAGFLFNPAFLPGGRSCTPAEGSPQRWVRKESEPTAADGSEFTQPPAFGQVEHWPLFVEKKPSTWFFHREVRWGLAGPSPRMVLGRWVCAAQLFERIHENAPHPPRRPRTTWHIRGSRLP